MMLEQTGPHLSCNSLFITRYAAMGGTEFSRSARLLPPEYQPGYLTGRQMVMIEREELLFCRRPGRMERWECEIAVVPSSFYLLLASIFAGIHLRSSELHRRVVRADKFWIE